MSQISEILSQLAGRLFAMKRLAVLMRWLSATEAHVSVGRMVYVFPTHAAVPVVRGNDDVAESLP
jgi:hypothetical protein